MTVHELNNHHPYAERMSALAESFPSLRGKSGIRPWRPMLLADMLGVLSHGEQCAARFVLNVWAGGAFVIDSVRGTVVCFDVVDALQTWDPEHRSAFAAFARSPFWP